MSKDNYVAGLKQIVEQWILNPKENLDIVNIDVANFKDKNIDFYYDYLQEANKKSLEIFFFNEKSQNYFSKLIKIEKVAKTVKFLGNCNKKGQCNAQELIYSLTEILTNDRLCLENIIDILLILPAGYIDFIETIMLHVLKKDKLDFKNISNTLIEIYKKDFENIVDKNQIDLLFTDYKKGKRQFTRPELCCVYMQYLFKSAITKGLNKNSIYYQNAEKLFDEQKNNTLLDEYCYDHVEDYLNQALEKTADILFGVGYN